MGGRARCAALVFALLVAGPGPRALADPPAVTVSAGDTAFDGELWVRSADGTATPVGGGGVECPGCVWRLVPACSFNAGPRVGPDGALLPADDNLCAGAVSGCTNGQIRYRAYRRVPGETFHLMATLCLGVIDEPISGAALRQQVARYFTSMPLPVPGLHVQPRGPSVVNIPALFYADAAPVRIDDFGPLGVRVRITAAPTSWRWQPAPGVSFTTDSPGAPYPNRDIGYSYTTTGDFLARVTATWTATYSVAGSGAELPVPGSVERTSTALVPVREARAELIDGPH